jgi:hypothetical protein
MNESSRPHLAGCLAGLFLASGIAFGSIILARTWTNLRESQVIEVTGSTRKNVRSDLAVWTARVSVEDPTIQCAYAKLKGDLEKVDRFLRSRNCPDCVLGPVQVRELTAARTKDAEEDFPTRRIGYHVSQSFKIASHEVESLPRLAGNCTELLDQGVVFISEGIEFIYTKAGKAKVEMMADATQDARARAEQIASQGGRRVRELRSSKMGVVQINPVYSTATSYEGNSDTTSIEKTIIVTISAQFALK